MEPSVGATNTIQVLNLIHKIMLTVLSKNIDQESFCAVKLLQKNSFEMEGVSPTDYN